MKSRHPLNLGSNSKGPALTMRWGVKRHPPFHFSPFHFSLLGGCLRVWALRGSTFRSESLLHFSLYSPHEYSISSYPFGVEF